MNLYTTGLSIGELARRTGIRVSTLRAWERRYGYPKPDRVASGHRRYTERDVEALAEVLKERQRGAALDTALARAAARTSIPRTSIFNALQRAVPDIPPTTLSARAMLALSRAIEDEAIAEAVDACFVGAFQEERAWRQAQGRWQHIATRSSVVMAFAAFPTDSRHANVWQVPIDAGAAIAREWVVLCDSPSFAACLAGVEMPGSGPESPVRRFRALWTVEPLGVREAARTALHLARSALPKIVSSVPARLSEPPVATYDTIRIATRLTNRVLRYVDRDDVARAALATANGTRG